MSALFKWLLPPGFTLLPAPLPFSIVIIAFYVHCFELSCTFLIAVGARVFARWTNGLYYRGFVSKSVSLTVSINYDDGGKITLAKNDKAAVILDKIPQDNKVKIGQKVIGYWPGRVRYYPGQISKFCDDGSKYFLKFNDGDERCEAVYEIRTVPEGTAV